jgi:hypothetical protein
MKKITRNNIVISAMRSPAPIVEYFLNYYGIKYYKKEYTNSLFCDALTKENKKILPFIFYFTGAVWHANSEYYYKKSKK